MKTPTNKAKDTVDNLNDGGVKENLSRRLEAVRNKIRQKEFEDQIRNSQNKTDTKELEKEIEDTITDEDIKQELLEKLNKRAIELATKAVELAEALKREPYISRAIVLVDVIKPCSEKTALEIRIANIKEVRTVLLGTIDATEENYEIKNAELDVKQAEAMKREPFLTKARISVTNLVDSPEKTVLMERLEALNRLLNSNSETEIKNAERTVFNAEKNKRESLLNTAKEIVNKLKPSEEKEAFLERLKVVEEEIKAKGEVEKPEAKNSESQLKRAEDAVKLAEQYKRKAYIDMAENIVKQLHDSREKTAFMKRLKALK